MPCDEAKRPLFAGAKLRVFDFVSIGRRARTCWWTVKGRKLSPQNGSLQKLDTREDMTTSGKWQEIFGERISAMFLCRLLLPGPPRNLNPSKT